MIRLEDTEERNTINLKFLQQSQLPSDTNTPTYPWKRHTAENLLSDITSSESEADVKNVEKYIVFCVPPACCIEKSVELTEALVKIDNNSGRKGDILSRHQGFESTHRGFLFDWIMDLGDFFGISRDTYYLALDYIDRYLSETTGLRKNRLQLIGLASLHIASKWEEVHAVKLIDWLCVSDNIFSGEEVLMMEKQILQTLGYRSTTWNLNKWLFTLLHIVQYEVNLFEYVRLTDLLDLIILDCESLSFSYSVLASTCIYLVTSVLVTVPENSDSQRLEISHCIVWIKKYWDVLSKKHIPKAHFNKVLSEESQCRLIKYSGKVYYRNLLDLYIHVNKKDLFQSQIC